VLESRRIRNMIQASVLDAIPWANWIPAVIAAAAAAGALRVYPE
jgi:hypothetical protein